MLPKKKHATKEVVDLIVLEQFLLEASRDCRIGLMSLVIVTGGHGPPGKESIYIKSRCPFSLKLPLYLGLGSALACSLPDFPISHSFSLHRWIFRKHVGTGDSPSIFRIGVMSLEWEPWSGPPQCHRRLAIKQGHPDYLWPHNCIHQGLISGATLDIPQQVKVRYVHMDIHSEDVGKISRRGAVSVALVMVAGILMWKVTNLSSNSAYSLKN